MIYTLALILTALKTSGYVYGIVASLFCVIAVNFLFSYPFLNLIFIGRISCHVYRDARDHTNHKRNNNFFKTTSKAAAEREKALAEADKEKLRANLFTCRIT